GAGVFGWNCSGGSNGDNILATSAALPAPTGIAFDSAGTLFIADRFTGLREVANGIITTVAGQGTDLGENIPALGAQLTPCSVTFDYSGVLYVTDVVRTLVRKISNGVIATIAGSGSIGFSGDGGPALNAQFNQVLGIAVDSAGNLLIVDDVRIRKVSNGTIT